MVVCLDCLMSSFVGSHLLNPLQMVVVAAALRRLLPVRLDVVINVINNVCGRFFANLQWDEDCKSVGFGSQLQAVLCSFRSLSDMHSLLQLD